MTRNAWWLAVLLIGAPCVVADTESGSSAPRLSELVSDPQHDWSGDAKVTNSDEYVELENPADQPMNVTGWRLLLNDTTPSTHVLSGEIPAGSWLVVLNPVGDLNNDAHVVLLDADGRIVDEVRFGSRADPSAPVPSADAHHTLDEALRRGGAGWAHGHATPGGPNEAPRWLARDAWESSDWVLGGSTAILDAEVVDSGRRFVSIVLDVATGDGNAAVAAATLDPTNIVRRTTNLTAPPESFRYRWSAADEAGAVWSSPWTERRVDSEPPRLPALPAVVFWRPPEAEWGPEPAVDAGVGGVEWQSATLDNGSWRETSWNASGNLALVAGTSPPILEARWRARDAFGQATAWSAPVRFVMDDVAPGPVTGLAAQGEGPIVLSWESAIDAGSGVVGQDLERAHGDQVATWSLAADARTWTDVNVPVQGAVTYRVRAVDAAGNEGPWTSVSPDHPGLHPAVQGIRVSKPVWKSGTLELRVDFDRAMDAALTPTVQVAGQGVVGRYFANHSTYYVELVDVEAFDEGAHTIRVLHAWDPGGNDLRAPAEAPLLVDRSPPALNVAPEAAFLRERSITLSATDQGSGVATIEWTLTAKGEPASSPVALPGDSVVVPVPLEGDWVLTARAADVAGWRTATLRRSFLADWTPPSIAPPTRDGAGWSLGLRDEGSGPDLVRLDLDAPQAWSVTALTAKDAFRLVPTAGMPLAIAGTAYDRAGNPSRFAFELDAAPVGERGEPLAPGPTPPSNRPANETAESAEDWKNWTAAWDASTMGQTRKTDPSPVAAAWIGSGLATLGLAAPLVARQRRRRHRRRPAASFAQRLRKARDGPSKGP